MVEWRLAGNKCEHFRQHCFAGMGQVFHQEASEDVDASGKKWVKIYHHRYTDFEAEMLPGMLKFINTRYNMHFQQEDFKDAWAMIRYILDREPRVDQSTGK